MLIDHPLRIDVTIFEKSKASPPTRVDEPTFLRYAWFCHFSNLLPRVCNPGAADYSLWAVCRYWERGDDRSRKLIQHLVASEYDLWTEETTHYY